MDDGNGVNGTVDDLRNSLRTIQMATEVLLEAAPARWPGSSKWLELIQQRTEYMEVLLDERTQSELRSERQTVERGVARDPGPGEQDRRHTSRDTRHRAVVAPRMSGERSGEVLKADQPNDHRRHIMSDEKLLSKFIDPAPRGLQVGTRVIPGAVVAAAILAFAALVFGLGALGGAPAAATAADAAATPAPAVAAPAPAEIGGRVTNAETGDPIKNAMVHLFTSDSGDAAERTVFTDAAGEYRFGDLAADAYRVRVEHIGFHPEMTLALRVEAGQRVEREFNAARRLVHVEGITVTVPRATNLAAQPSETAGAALAACELEPVST